MDRRKSGQPHPISLLDDYEFYLHVHRIMEVKYTQKVNSIDGPLLNIYQSMVSDIVGEVLNGQLFPLEANFSIAANMFLLGYESALLYLAERKPE